MKHTILILLLAASTVAANAQPLAKPAAPAAAAHKPSAPAAAKPAAAAITNSPAIAAVIKAPANIPVVKGIQKPVFTVALRYQEIKIGTGAVAEPNKLYKVLYTGWRAVDGVKFDSTDDHPRPPVLDKDGKPVLGADGKPKQGPPQPVPFPQGMGGTVLGFDQGFVGMKIGGQRRIFIPWQLAYGTRTLPPQPGHEAEHPGIPAKSDLIFDVELVDVTDMPAPQTRPGMMPGMRPMPNGMQMPPIPGTAPKPPVATAPAQPATPPVPSAAPAPAAPVPPQPK